MLCIRDLKGHKVARKSAIKHSKIYGTEEPTFTYFDIDGSNPQRNIIIEGRLCTKGSEIMGKMIDGCPFVYMAPDYWNSLAAEEKISKAKGYFDRMIEGRNKESIPQNAHFVVRVARMNVETSWCSNYGSYQPDYILYKDYLKMTNNKFAGFLDALFGNSLASRDQPSTRTHHGASDNDSYFPTSEDYHNARRKLLRGKTKNRTSVNDVLDMMQDSIEQSGRMLASGWRTATAHNILTWSQKGEDENAI